MLPSPDNFPVQAVIYALLVSVSAVTARAQAVQAVPLRQAQRLLPAITEQVSKQALYPHDKKVIVTVTGGGASQVRIGQQFLVIVPVQIQFQDIGNSYCRLAVLSQDEQQARLIPLPISADTEPVKSVK